MFDPDRLLIIAPHPDDETIATGGLIQRARSVRVLFVTDGERNPWPQRATLRRWRINDEDRRRWGELRREEARASLALLGAAEESARFLGLPDAELMRLARTGGCDLTAIVQDEVRKFAPTLVVSPSSFDLHSDHRASAWFVHQAIAPGMPLVTYVIHGEPPPSRAAFELELTEPERLRKREAIECHASQLRLSRSRFLAHARSRELFCAPEHDRVHIDTRATEILGSVRHALHVLRPWPRPSR
jgi:LmbE family N-acetylglucosaminyl deacetylase